MSMIRLLRNYAELSLAIAGTIFVVLIRLYLVRKINFCGVPDSCAYLSLAESLSKNHSFLERFVFDFQLDRVTFPTHGIEYWRPGTSFFFLLAKPFGAVTLHSSLVITVLIGVFLSAAAWRIAIRYTDDRRIACASYLLCLVLPTLWDSSSIPDSGLFYGAFVAWFLALFTVRFQSYLSDILALGCISITYLIRNDALLLLVPFLVVLLLRLRSRGEKGSSPLYCFLMVAGFFVALAPMHLVYFEVLGKALPSGSYRVLFMNSLSAFSFYQAPVTLHSWLSIGVSHLIAIRVKTLPMIVYRILFLMVGFGMIFLPVFAVRRKDGTRTPLPEYAGSGSFAATIVLAYGLVLPAIGVFSALRTFMGLLPFVALLIMVGLSAAIESRKAAMTATAGVCIVYFVTGLMAVLRTIPLSEEERTADNQVASVLAADNALPSNGTLIMTGDPVQFSETTSYPTMEIPANGLVAIQRAIADFKVTYILLDADHVPMSLDEINATLHPIRVIPVPKTHTLVLALPGS